MNELEKAYQEIECWHCCAEQEGFVNENDILYLDYVKKHINNLQSKIDKAVEYIINHSEEYKPHFRKIELDTVQCNELLNILEEDKIKEIPQFKGTMEQLDNLCDIKKE